MAILKPHFQFPISTVPFAIMPVSTMLTSSVPIAIKRFTTMPISTLPVVSMAVFTLRLALHILTYLYDFNQVPKCLPDQ